MTSQGAETAQVQCFGSNDILLDGYCSGAEHVLPAPAFAQTINSDASPHQS